MFNPYNESEITDLAPTLTCHCGSWSSSATVLILEEDKNEEMDRNGNQDDNTRLKCEEIFEWK